MACVRATIEDTCRVAVTQMACTVDWEANCQQAETLVREAVVKQGADIVLLQELFSGLYFCIDQLEQHFALALPAEISSKNPLLERMSKLACELNVVLPVSFFERAGNVFFNTIAILDSDGTLLGFYRKSHIPDGPGYTEKFYFSPGDTGFRVWHTRKGVTIGVGICWDQWNVECARCMTLQGADLLLYPTAIGTEPPPAPPLDSRQHWRRAMQGHAAANICPVIAANRVGLERSIVPQTDRFINFYGSSFIADETGAIIAELGSTENGVTTAEFNFRDIRDRRSGWGLFRDRRPELYHPLLTLDGAMPHFAAHVALPYHAAPTMPQTPMPLPAPALHNKRKGREAMTKYRMPAEWELHSQCWLGFPVNPNTWYAVRSEVSASSGTMSSFPPAQEAFVALAQTISRFEPVTMCVPANAWQRAHDLLGEGTNDDFQSSLPNLRIVEMAQNDGAWMRDQAPIFVEMSKEQGTDEAVIEIVGICWEFDAWGQVCYSDWSEDAKISRKICSLERIRSIRPKMVLEGGSVHVDGEGTLLTTTECLLESNPSNGRRRNENLDRAAIEARLCRYFGVSVVLWLPFGVAGDLDTNGHVDNLACFLRPGTVALHWIEQDEDPEQHQRSAAALAYLEGHADARGRRIEVVKILGPRGIVLTEDECEGLTADSDSGCQRTTGEKLPGSYINFYMPNGAAIVPQFGDNERDAAALCTFRKYLPDREIVPFPSHYSRLILCGGGNIHCVTMQQCALSHKG